MLTSIPPSRLRVRPKAPMLRIWEVARMAEFRGWGGAALITGGSEGIGVELARQFARRRIDLLLVARSAANLRVQSQRLASSHGVRVEWVDADLAAADGP